MVVTPPYHKASSQGGVMCSSGGQTNHPGTACEYDGDVEDLGRWWRSRTVTESHAGASAIQKSRTVVFWVH